MELLKLRKRLVVARRGHKLLKDKLDGLTKEFMRVSQEYKNLRIALDEELPRVLKLFVLAGISSSRLIVENALDSTRQDLEIVKHEKRLMGVMIPKLEAVFGDVTGHYSLVHTPPELDQAIASLKDFLPKLLHMAEIEETVRRMSMELEKTRRRVYDMLVADKMRVQGFHYPFPANGFVEKDGNGYRLIPAPWNPVI